MFVGLELRIPKQAAKSMHYAIKNGLQLHRGLSVDNYTKG